MRNFPSGTVTFLFTDVEGSTRRWEQDLPATLTAIERHFQILDHAISGNDGVRFKTIGDGVQAAFPTALDGILAAADAQRALHAEDWGDLGPINVRMALHTGTATPRDGDYLAPALNRLSRLLAAGHGGQVLVSEVTRQLVRELLPPDLDLLDLGEHRLRDLRDAEHVYQLTIAGLNADFPPLKSLERTTHNLPTQPTPFIGRVSEVAEIRGQLEHPDVRLLTLTGPGGVGKTRLALHIAAELIEAFADGVWFVALAPVMTPTLVVTAIAETLGIREPSGAPIEETLVSFLRRQNVLLVLDNFEHVVDASPLIAELLASCPRLKVLATSRGPLHLTGEYEFPVPALELPPVDAELGVDDALAWDAVRLFVDRARAVQSTFELIENNVETVVAICRRLDGLPLAIELAASRVRLLPPDAILARLDSRLSLLTGGGRDLPERQQTLRGAIAWSHDLLDPVQQAFFRRLAVFAGGWSLDAAEAVTGLGGDPPVPVFDGLESLHDTSLIRREESLEPRFAMLQTIHEFATEQLKGSGELAATKAHHAALFLTLATEAEPHLGGPTAVSWLDRLEADHDNLRAALDWLGAESDGERTVRLAAALWRFWWLRGHVAEGRERLERALAIPDSRKAAARAAALDGAGVLAEAQRDYDRAEELHLESLALSREQGDPMNTARALGNLGVVAYDRGDDDRAASLLAESLDLARCTGDQNQIATALNDLGNVAYNRSELDRAETLYQESLTLRRVGGSTSEIARVLNNLGSVAFDRGDMDRACRLFGESLSLYRETRDPWGAAGALINLAVANHRQGQAQRAVALLEESLSLFREVGDLTSAALAALNLADALRDTGDIDQAAVHYHDAIAAFGAHDEERASAGLAGLGSVMVRKGQFEEAAQLLGAVSALSESQHSGSVTAANLDDDLEQIRTALTEERFTSSWEAGRALSLEEAVQAALAHDIVDKP